jgi:hypothetical protein
MTTNSPKMTNARFELTNAVRHFDLTLPDPAQ